MFDWIQSFADWLIYTVAGLPLHSKWGDALNFFVYDTLKILLLLFLITSIMGVVNSYFPVDRIRNYLSRNKLYGLEYFLASTFGAITPFCSCSSVPLFIGFVKGGIPLGVTFAFLITSPLVNEVALAMFVGMFGLKATIIYATSGILLGTIGGIVLGRLKLEKHLTPWVQNILANAQAEEELEEEKQTLWQRLPGIFKEALGIIKGVFWYIIIGIGIGAAMHGFIPTGFFERYISKDNPFAVPIAVILGVPMYSNAAGVLPIIQVFVQKGIPIGTAIAFMMAVVGLSIPEATLLKKVMTWKMIAIFFAVVTFFIMLSGYLFNIIL
ncbi:permease [Flavihumibacter stibioxidans]|uniref:Permease n=1 Tax=Flavihumibacter stibioxidans TaxID=1834163 RepID=A0ABR7M8G2_9BACT|nr:permease [Flavihumibacter stibioxidans]MBC6491308.1 permease [Flavihumibacter stibioxidans]